MHSLSYVLYNTIELNLPTQNTLEYIAIELGIDFSHTSDVALAIRQIVCMCANDFANVCDFSLIHTHTCILTLKQAHGNTAARGAHTFERLR